MAYTFPKIPGRNRSSKNEEWGRERGGILVCPQCANVHYEKKWHSAGKKIPKYFLGVKIKETLCQACTMINNHEFEGEILIENLPDVLRGELVNLISAFNRRAMVRDPQDRVIKIESIDHVYRITTTENQLAVKLAKKIKEVFNAFDLHISYAPEPAEVSRVHMKFTKNES